MYANKWSILREQRGENGKGAADTVTDLYSRPAAQWDARIRITRL